MRSALTDITVIRTITIQIRVRKVFKDNYLNIPYVGLDTIKDVFLSWLIALKAFFQ